MKAISELAEYPSRKPHTIVGYLLPRNVMADGFGPQLIEALVDACNYGHDGHKIIAAEVVKSADAQLELRVAYQSEGNEHPNAGGRW